MAKSVLGIDIGYDRLKLALVNGKKIRKAVSVAMPKKLMREGRVVSQETMGELIRTTMRENGIHANSAAIVFNNETVFVRNVVVPEMTADQLIYNLPYEFRDYITDELKNYVFDYAMLPAEESEAPAEGETGTEAGTEAEESRAARTMELMAVAAPTALLDESRAIVRKAGLKLVKAGPVVSSYIALIRNMEDSFRPEGGEYCILDLGYRSIRMDMFRGDRHMVTRELEVGLSQIDDVIADACNVDVHLAHTYLLTNYDDCQNKDYCLSAFNNIAVELMRALNFYRFSNPDSHLNDIWLCGGGAEIMPLRSAISETLDLNLHDAHELIPGGVSFEECGALVQAIGITLE